MTKQETTKQCDSLYPVFRSEERKHIGVMLRPQKKQNGTYFWTYEPVRFAGYIDGKPRYFNTFSSRDDAALADALSQAIQFRDQVDATEHVERVMAEKSKKQAA